MKKKDKQWVWPGMGYTSKWQSYETHCEIDFSEVRGKLLKRAVNILHILPWMLIGSSSSVSASRSRLVCRGVSFPKVRCVAFALGDPRVGHHRRWWLVWAPFLGEATQIERKWQQISDIPKYSLLVLSRPVCDCSCTGLDQVSGHDIVAYSPPSSILTQFWFSCSIKHLPDSNAKAKQDHRTAPNSSWMVRCAHSFLCPWFFDALPRPSGPLSDGRVHPIDICNEAAWTGRSVRPRFAWSSSYQIWAGL